MPDNLEKRIKESLLAELAKKQKIEVLNNRRAAIEQEFLDINTEIAALTAEEAAMDILNMFTSNTATDKIYHEFCQGIVDEVSKKEDSNAEEKIDMPAEYSWEGGVKFTERNVSPAPEITKSNPEIKKGLFKKHEDEELLRMHEAGVRPGEIAKKLNRYPTTIGSRIKRLKMHQGRKKLKKGEKIVQHEPIRPMKTRLSNGHLTAYESAKFVVLYNQDMPLEEIAAELSRTIESARRQIQILLNDGRIKPKEQTELKSNIYK